MKHTSNWFAVGFEDELNIYIKNDSSFVLFKFAFQKTDSILYYTSIDEEADMKRFDKII